MPTSKRVMDLSERIPQHGVFATSVHGSCFALLWHIRKAVIRFRKRESRLIARFNSRKNPKIDQTDPLMVLSFDGFELFQPETRFSGFRV